ncbi:MAG: hypothetical protein WCF07_07720, partial [Nitrososphaeraceae archaeon]
LASLIVILTDYLKVNIMDPAITNEWLPMPAGLRLDSLSPPITYPTSRDKPIPISYSISLRKIDITV